MEKLLEYVQNMPKWSYILLLLIGLAVIQWIIFKIIRLVVRRSSSKIDDIVIGKIAGPVQWVVIVLIARFIMTFMDQVYPDSESLKNATESIQHAFSVVIIIVVAWLVIRIVSALEDFLSHKFNMEVSDNLQARKIHTQLRVMRQIIVVFVVIIAFASILMTFPRVRQLGTSLLASAGIAGVIIGFAAQKSLGTLIAGIQIAITQPIRIDDVVIVEGEWGRIEEITLTYVVVRIWDLRRLIVPITYFIDTPFQNWTRVTADILGTVYVYMDYSVPVEAVREQLKKLLEESEHWDGKVCGTQVTNATERTVEIRALMSASDASKAWTLRCEIREKMLAYLRDNYPQSLPRVRAELEKQPMQEKNG